MLAPQSSGGLALGCIEGAIAFEQLGRHLVPGPLLWSVLAAMLVPEVAGGAVVATGIDARADAPHLVEHLRPADLLLVLRADGVSAVERDAIDSTPIDEPFDPLAATDALRVHPGRPSDRRTDATPSISRESAPC